MGVEQFSGNTDCHGVAMGYLHMSGSGYNFMLNFVSVGEIMLAGLSCTEKSFIIFFFYKSFLLFFFLASIISLPR